MNIKQDLIGAITEEKMIIKSNNVRKVLQNWILLTSEEKMILCFQIIKCKKGYIKLVGLHLMRKLLSYVQK